MITNNNLGNNTEKMPVVTLTEGAAVQSEFYPRTSASGKEKTAYFGVLTIDGKVCSISHCDEIPKAIAHYLDNAEIVFTPF